jgi:dTDP-4-dehydrorhamnose reductase
VRVLVTGGGGLLGGRIAALLHERGFDVLAQHRRTPPPPGLRTLALELGDTQALAALFDRERPDGVVHAAAMSRANHCMERPDDALAVNARLPGEIARLCRERGLRLVAISTDLVFAGERAPLREDSPTGPRNAYGASKLAGERAVLEAHPEAAVARVALVVGRGHGPKGTSSEQIAWALRSRRGMTLFTDEHRTPVDAESLADALARLLGSDARGVFHLGGPERVSRHELGLRVARLLGLDPAPLVAGLQKDHAGPDRRPGDVSLDSTRAQRELGWQPRPLDAAILESRQEPDAS